MTRPRQPMHGRVAGLVLAATVFAAPLVRAEGATPIAGPAVLAPAPAPAPAPGAATAKAAGDKAAWLRPSAPAKKQPVASAPASAGPVRVVFAGVVVAALGAAAMFHRRRRRGVAQTLRSELTVVSRARVGNKADVVVLDVGGRKILLGVTDSEVSRLAWLDGAVEGAEFEGAPEVSSFEGRALAAPAPRALEPAIVVEPEAPRGFRDVLKSAMGKARPARQEPAPNAALAIAESTENVVFARSSVASPRVAAPAGAPDMVDIEGQARGLVLRLSKRA